MPHTQSPLNSVVNVGAIGEEQGIYLKETDSSGDHFSCKRMTASFIIKFIPLYPVECNKLKVKKAHFLLYLHDVLICDLCTETSGQERSFVSYAPRATVSSWLRR